MLAADDTMKRCTKCGETKPLDRFQRCSKVKDGRQSQCKDCRHLYYVDNSEHIRAKTRRNRAANAEARREYDRRYYREHSEQCRERARMYNQTHADQVRAAKAAWKLSNRDKVRASGRRWYARHADEGRERSRARALNNPDYFRKWHAANRDRVRQYHAKRRACKRGAIGAEHIDRSAIWERDGGICHLCGKPCATNNWHMDHLIPLSLGGPHTAANVAVSHPRCNLSRGNRGPAQLRLIA